MVAGAAHMKRARLSLSTPADFENSARQAHLEIEAIAAGGAFGHFTDVP